MADLRSKVHLNRGELPLPRDAAGGSPTPAGGRTPIRTTSTATASSTAADYATATPRRRPERQRRHRPAGPDHRLLRRRSTTTATATSTTSPAGTSSRTTTTRSTTSRTATAPARRATRRPRPTTAATSAPARTAWSLPVRVGDSFVADVEPRSRRASSSPSTAARTSIQEALGTFNNSTLRARGDRLRLRERRAGDRVGRRRGELPPQLPGGEPPHDHGELGHARRRRSPGCSSTPPSYLFLNGCTNYGGNMARRGLVVARARRRRRAAAPASRASSSRPRSIASTPAC